MSPSTKTVVDGGFGLAQGNEEVVVFGSLEFEVEGLTFLCGRGRGDREG